MNLTTELPWWPQSCRFQTCKYNPLCMKSLKSDAVLFVAASTEFDALREGELRRVIDGARAPAHVLLPRVTSALSADARLFLASEGAANLSSARSDVYIYNSAVAASRAHPFEGASIISRKQTRT